MTDDVPDPYDAPEPGDALDPEAEFESLRPRLFGVAYRILGSVADAEDVVQETWIAWQRTARTEVTHPAAYLTKAASRHALNLLRTRSRQREQYVGPWLPEPLDASHSPEEAAEIADSVSFAMLELLEKLSPKERVAFVMREVFEVPAAEVAETLDSTPEAVRTLVSRARSHIRKGSRRYDTDPQTHLALGSQFSDALRRGDLEAACSVLSPDVLLITDSGGRAKAARRPIQGAEKVARFFIGLVNLYGDFDLRSLVLNAQPASLIDANGDLTVVTFGVVDGRIERIWSIRNPDKLHGISVESG